MKLREPLPARCSAMRIRHCLAVLLLAGWNTAGSRAGGRLRVTSPSLLGYSWVDSIPYAIVAGAPPLRFAAAPPAPEPMPAAIAETPIPIPASGGVVAHPPETHPAEAGPLPSVPATTSASAATEKISATETSAPAMKRHEEVSTATSILPDELHPQVRPEDFLPFFQVPGASNRGPQATLVMPLPALSPGTSTAATPSSATYTQTPK